MPRWKEISLKIELYFLTLSLPTSPTFFFSYKSLFFLLLSLSYLYNLFLLPCVSRFLCYCFCISSFSHNHSLSFCRSHSLFICFFLFFSVTFSPCFGNTYCLPYYNELKKRKEELNARCVCMWMWIYYCRLSQCICVNVLTWASMILGWGKPWKAGGGQEKWVG